MRLRATALCCLAACPGGGGVLDISLGRGCRPELETLTLFMTKKTVKILKNRYPVYDFQIKFHSFFRRNARFLDPVYKNSSKIVDFETLFMTG